MTQVSVSGLGLHYPNWFYHEPGQGLSNPASLDAAGEKMACFGHIFIDGRASSKTISAAGGGKIHFLTSTVTWATSGTTLVVGIQDVSTTAGPGPEPDGTFDVSDDLVQGTDTLSSNTATTVTMSSGSKTINHGDFLAVVFDMTVRNGTDSVTLRGASRGGTPHRPCIRSFTTSWANPGAVVPMIVIEFDDGTLGWFYGGYPVVTFSAESFSDSTNPDERGNIFKVPWDCKIEGFWIAHQVASAAGDFDIKLYSDPLGTPSLVTSMSILAEQIGQVGITRGSAFMLGSEISLTRDTDYWLAIKATGTGNFTHDTILFSDANFRKVFTGGTTVLKGTRNNSTGAATTTNTIQYRMGVIISSFEDTAAAGGGGSVGRILTPVMGSTFFRY